MFYGCQNQSNHSFRCIWTSRLCSVQQTVRKILIVHHLDLEDMFFDNVHSFKTLGPLFPQKRFTPDLLGPLLWSWGFSSLWCVYHFVLVMPLKGNKFLFEKYLACLIQQINTYKYHTCHQIFIWVWCCIWYW